MTAGNLGLLATGASTLLCFGAAGLLHAMLRSSALWRPVHRYLDAMTAELRFLQLPHTGRDVLMGQLMAAAAAVAGAAFIAPWIAAALVPIGWLPWAWLSHQRHARVQRIEEQLDGWLLVLSNALKASPSLGEAMRSSVRLVAAPFAQEVDLLLKEYALGTPLDRALEETSRRIGSPVVTSALLTLRIARRTGGDLNETLETSAASLREMARLEGVVRSKTAEGKAQAVLIGIIPLPLFGCLNWIDPNFLAPLVQDIRGYLVIAGAGALWLCALVMAHRIVDVDI